MLDLADITMLVLTVLTAAAYHISFTRRWINRHKSEASRYRLFAVRDALIRLVAEGKLREDSIAFKKVYESVSLLVGHTDHITLRPFIEGLVLARKKGFDPLSSEDQELSHELRNNRDYAEVLLLFFKAVTFILWQKSYVLRIAVWCTRFFPRKVGGNHLPPVQQNALRFYQDYTQASRRVSATAA